MAFLEQIGGLLQQYASGTTTLNREQAQSDYDTISSAVPTNILGSVIGPALGSLGNAQVEERIRHAASEMTPDTRGQFLRHLLSTATGDSTSSGSILSQLGIDPTVRQQPAQASPDDVAKVAAHMHQTQPDAFNQAMAFFGQHPALVKVLGTLAIGKIAQHLHTRAPQLAR